MRNKIYLGSLAVVVAAILWSLDGTFLRPQLYTLPSVLVVFLEHALGFVVLFPFLIIYRKQLKEINKKQWAAVFWVALFGGALGTTFITKALFLTGFVDVSVVILLQKFQPIFAITLAAIFLRERFPKIFYLYAGIAVVAGYFVTFKDPFTVDGVLKTTGMVALYALLAAFAWGSSTTFGKYSIKNISYGLLAALRFGLTVIIMAFPALYYYSGQFSVVAPKQWGILTIIVFTSGAAGMFLYYYGLKKIPASIATLCELSWPVSAIFFDYFLNKNILSWTQLLGATVLIIMVYLTTRLNKSRVLVGLVETEANRGEKMGAKTANLNIKLAGNLPKGLYTCEVEANGKKYQGLLYYGHNSMTGKDSLEVHILNFSANIYGHQITVITDKFLRLPKTFKNPEDLILQIKKDLEMV